MEASKGKKRSPKSADQPQAKTDKTVENHFRVFQDAIAAFLEESQQKAVALQQEFYQIVGDYQVEFQKSKEEEYRRLATTIQESLGQEKSNELIEKAKEAYLANLEEKKTFIEKGIEEAREKYRKQLEAIATANRKQYHDAYQALIKALKAEVSGINLKDIQPEALAKAGHSLVQSSRYALVE
ncbi:MAG: hypothetical protein AAFW73_25880 [Bacteroidota bacterium]